MITGHFEAQKHGFKQTSKGFVVSLLIHPNDISPTFLAAPTGTRFQIGYAEINDTEIPHTVTHGAEEEGGDGDTSLEVTSHIEDAIPADWNNPFGGG